jgi:hypothetical protein
MKLNMSAGPLAAALRSVPAKYAVLVEEGDSFLPQTDDAAQTVTVRHAGEGKSMSGPSLSQNYSPPPIQAMNNDPGYKVDMQALPKKAKAKKAKAEGA